MKLNWKPTPISGIRREAFKFAFWPIEVEGQWIWLERYISEQTYTTNPYDGGGWCEIRRRVMK